MKFLFSRIRKLLSNSEFEGPAKRIKYDPELKKSIEKHTYTWVLHNFFSVLVPKYNSSSSYLTSPLFGRNGSKYKWHISCYPNGYQNKNCISVFLSRTTTCEMPINCTFRIKNSDDETLTEETMKLLFSNDIYCYGFPVLATHEMLKTITDDIMKIQVVISIEVICNDDSFLPHPKLAQDLKSALKGNLDTDFILKVEDLELPVHKFIISARSPVFSSMLKNDTLEKSEGSMQIKDIDKETLILLVDFIYTGNVTELSCHEAEKLLYAANKYLLPDLEKICENELIEKLKVSNVGDILILADFHNVINLKTEAINFIVQHHWKFINGTLFQELAEKSPNLLNEVVFKLIEQIPCTTQTALRH